MSNIGSAYLGYGPSERRPDFFGSSIPLDRCECGHLCSEHLAQTRTACKVDGCGCTRFFRSGRVKENGEA